jgi:hypothetical protein
MSDIYLLGGSTAIHQMDAQDSYLGPQSSEVATTMVYRSKAYSPVGWGGEAIFRRLYVTVQYDSQIQVFVSLVIDGKPMPGTLIRLSRSQGSERHTFTVPLGIVDAEGYVRAVRGTSVQVEFSVTAPTARWYIEPPVLQWAPALSIRRFR